MDAATSIYSLSESPWVQLGFKDDHKVYHSIQYNSVDPYWLQLMKIEVVQGRLFSPGNTADKTTAAVVNEAFLKEFNLKDPVGKKLPGRFEQQIIGVVKDFNIESLHTKVKPMMLTISPDSVFSPYRRCIYNGSPATTYNHSRKAGQYCREYKFTATGMERCCAQPGF